MQEHSKQSARSLQAENVRKGLNPFWGDFYKVIVVSKPLNSGRRVFHFPAPPGPVKTEKIKKPTIPMIELQLKGIFIINSGAIIWSEVASNHNELHIQKRKSTDTTGGGNWHLDKQQRILIFFGTSPYGTAGFGEIKNAILESRLPFMFPNYKIRFSEKEFLPDALDFYAEIPLNEKEKPAKGSFWK